MNTTERREKKQEIKTKYASLASHLNERTRRLWAATEAVAIGYGGVYLVSEVVGIDRNTVMAGIREISRDYSIFAGFYYGLRGACIV